MIIKFFNISLIFYYFLGMKNLKTFNLISGKFLPEESREILSGIFSSKIQFHQMKNFTSRARLGKEDKLALKRIIQLKMDVAEIMKMIQIAEENGLVLEMKSIVVINFAQPNINV